MMRRTPLLAPALLLLLAGPAAAQSLRGIRKDFAEIGERVIPATVIVRSPDAEKYILGSSAVLVSEDGYVLSDADACLLKLAKDQEGKIVKLHGRTAVVTLPAPDRRAFKAVLLRRDEESDTSLLRIQDPPKDLPTVPLGRSDPLRIGSFLVVVSNTYGTGTGAEPALTMGVVSALPTNEGRPGGRYEAIYTGAGITAGSNGGPVVGIGGRLVGVVSGPVTEPTSPYRSLGRVTPVDRIRDLYRDVTGAGALFAPPDESADVPRDAAILEDAFAIIARHAAPSLVSLTVKRSEGATTTEKMRDRAGKEVDVPLYTGPYSGLVLRRDGYLLTSTTNLWAYGQIESVTAHFHDGRDLPATIFARDRYRDIALLKVDADDLVPLPAAGPEDAVVGRFAIALGNPFGAARPEAPMFTFGLVSDLHRLGKDYDAIQTDAGMNDGMVGGALVTLEGKLLGLNVLVTPERFGRNSGIGFAIPMSAIGQTLPRLMEGKSVEPGWLGIAWPVTTPDGIVFPGVLEDGPAGAGGLKAGDVLLTVDGRPASDFPEPDDFIAYLRSKEPGETLLLGVKRGTATVALTITLGSRPDR